jgi:hypothetical protein
MDAPTELDVEVVQLPCGHALEALDAHLGFLSCSLCRDAATEVQVAWKLYHSS